jgi:replicative DNA helicase
MQEPIAFPQQPRSPIDQLRLTILSGLSDPTLTIGELNERLAFLNSRLTDDHFSNSEFNTLYKVLTQYITVSGASPTASDFDELLAQAARLPLESKASLSTLYASLLQEGSNLSNARYRLAIERLRERYRDSLYATALENAARIHASAVSIGDQVLAGYDDSLSYLTTQLSTIATRESSSISEGELALEVNDILHAYNAAKSGHSRGILTGFHDLDAVTQGIQPGELALIAAYTGEGKSKLSYNITYDAVYNQGKTVLFGTAEATREQVRRNLIVRHTHHPKFDRKGGIRYSDLKFGTLSPTDEQILRAVLSDLKTNPESVYGRCFIFNVPHRANMRYIHDAFERFSKIASIDLVVVDYLGLMSSETRRAARREELDDLLVAAKRFAVDKDVPLLSPWQVSRNAWQEAQKSGKYTKACLSDTSQAERSTDLVLSILRKEDEPNALSATVLKSRDSEEDVAFTLHTDYSTSYVGTDTTMTGLF